MIWIGLIIGLALGGAIGVIIMALIRASGDDGKHCKNERAYEKLVEVRGNIHDNPEMLEVTK